MQRVALRVASRSQRPSFCIARRPEEARTGDIDTGDVTARCCASHAHRHSRPGTTQFRGPGSGNWELSWGPSLGVRRNAYVRCARRAKRALRVIIANLSTPASSARPFQGPVTSGSWAGKEVLAALCCDKTLKICVVKPQEVTLLGPQHGLRRPDWVPRRSPGLVKRPLLRACPIAPDLNTNCLKRPPSSMLPPVPRPRCATAWLAKSLPLATSPSLY
ncbi:hypothetical protein PSPO01_09563 [Paraphaeosphaeria sporulosa]